MIKALFTSATGLNAQQIVVDNTANNLANVNTTGFKRSQIDFKDLIYETMKAPGTETAQGVQSPTGLQIGSGVRVSGNTKVFTKGVLENTNNPLDIAIEGDGFFKVTMPSGEVRFTRDGSLRLNANRQLVNSEGFALEPAITLPNDVISVSIGADGSVSVTTAGGQGQASTQGQLTIVRFPNPAGLSSEGSNLYAQSTASGQPQEATPGRDGAGALRQYFLEKSNVEVVQELVSLIQAQRAYEFNTKAIRVVDEMLSSTNNITR